jgi:GAF domain-containing protein
MKCPRCQHEHPSQARFCMACGAGLGVRAKPATPRGKAKRSVSRKTHKNESGGVHDLEERLSEALKGEAEAREQQAATSELLKVIGSSMFDLGPVFETLAENAVRLCAAEQVTIFRFDGQFLRAVVTHNLPPAQREFLERNPIALGLHSGAGRAALERRTIHIHDIQTDREYTYGSGQLPFRTLLAIPLFRANELLGAISIQRDRVWPFTDSQIALMETFADQAAIAIENVRLFTELQEKNRALTQAHAQVSEALEQQTATGEILRVISSSPTDVQPVFEAIANSAFTLCAAKFVVVFTLQNGMLEIAAMNNISPAGIEALHRAYPMPVGTTGAASRAALTGQVVNIPDVFKEDDYGLRSVAQVIGLRSITGVPMIRDGQVIGVITVPRAETGGLSDTQIKLLQTFADQAVIAIENVRLFTELQEKNRALTQAHAQVTESLEQQTATSEILRVISSSPTDVQPVFDTIVRSATRLCRAVAAAVFVTDGRTLYEPANYGGPPEALAAARARYPRPLDRETASGTAILTRSVVHVPDVEDQSATEFASFARRVGRAIGFRSLLSVPMLREGEAVGAINVTRSDPGLFSDTEVALLRTFADQAVIAIENVRLFTELQASNRELTTALDQQTATSDILRVISRSQTDVQPVFDAILSSAVRLLRGYSGTLAQIAGDQIELAAYTSTGAAGDAVARDASHRPLDSEGVHARTIRDRAPMTVANLQTDPRFPERVHAFARARGLLGVITVPLLRHGEALGSIAVARREPGEFNTDELGLLQTFADQAVIAIENVRLFKELEARNRDLTATGEILQVISRSPTNVQPVFDTIVRNAVNLCDGFFSGLFRVDGGRIHFMAHHNWPPAGLEEYLRTYPIALDDTTLAGQVILERRVLHVEDVSADSAVPSWTRGTAAMIGYRTLLLVPMLREGSAIGVLGIARREARPFSDKQVELVKTFADQAVIAIENVRLFTELQEKNRALTEAHAQVNEALERQTATSEILGVISRSPTDVQPVLDAIARSAAPLCEAYDASVWLEDDETLVVRAHHGPIPSPPQRLPIGRDWVTGRAVVDGRPIHVDNLATAGDEFPAGQAMALRDGHRTTLATPLLREGKAIGAILIRRAEVRAFSDKHIALLKTFADQAVIAIENVRLFTELQEKNRALTEAHAQVSEALDRQTATSEILSVISQSQTDVQPVFDAIMRNAVRLSGAIFGTVLRSDGEFIDLAAHYNFTEEQLAQWQRIHPLAITDGRPAARAIRTAQVYRTADWETDANWLGISPEAQANMRARGVRSGLVVPMLREDKAIGAITLTHREVGAFSDAHVQLLQIFADQAVIAIENVRLFTELQARNRDLTATGEILQVISRSPTDAQPVFDTIADNAVRLFRPWSVAVYRFDGEFMHVAAVRGGLPGSEQYLREQGGRRPTRDVMAGRCIIDRSVIHVPDFETDPNVPMAAREIARVRGFRATINVPMLRRGEPIGVISVSRAETGPFSQAEIDLLQTFADQAVIAIENVRLFKELQARTGELTRSVSELRALGEVSQALSSTLDVDVVLNTIVTRANDLIGADGCTIFEYNEVTEQFHLRATRNLEPRLVELARGTPLRKGDQGILGQLPMGRQAVQVPDITAGSYSSPISDALIEAGYRAVVAVPLIREDHLIGALTMNRKTPGEFPAETIELLQTFATQSALAIQNARLFREIEQKSRELEAASRHKSEFLANMSHELRTPLNAVIGFSEVLSERMFGELNEKQDEYLKDIHASGQHLLSLINDILDLSKIEAGRMELELSDFDLPMTIDNALTLVRERAARRSIALNTAVDERVGQVHADERKIRQVLLNLLSNAIKFTPEGGRIHVEARSVNESIEVSVTDTGVGIAPEDQEAVFEEFRQVGTAEKKVEGTGLGLALSRKFIELHGGKIWVKSEVGAGSTFTFTVPVRRGE